VPLHRHECQSCGHRFRVLELRGAENGIPTCPECGSTETHRLLPLVAVQFKGSGYYKTDYRRGGSRVKKGSEEPGSSDSSEPKASEKSDTKTSGDS
jgi:putative FmdB family regulatory protein